MKRVIHAVSVMNRAGQETFLMNLYRNIDRDKVQFDFQTSLPEEGDYDSEIKMLGGKILYLGANHCRFPIIKYLNDIYLQYRFFKKHLKYDIYHIHTYHAFNAWLNIIGARMGGVSRIFLHSHNTYGMHPVLHKLFRCFLKFMRIERLACSEAAGEWMFGEKEMNNGRVTIIYNGVDPGQFIYDEVTRNQKRDEMKLQGKFVVGHIGRFTRQKNHQFLIRIFSELKKIQEDAILILVGIGELEETVRKQVAELGLKDSVQFLGTRKDIREILFAMDVFLFPSLHEGLSVVAIEAQAAGTQIVAADTLTKETQITDCLQFLSLDAGARQWAEKLVEAAARGHKKTINDVRSAGYDMSIVAREMQKKYTGIS